MRESERSRCTFPGCRRFFHSHGLCKGHDQQRRAGRALTELRGRGYRERPPNTVRVSRYFYLSSRAMVSSLTLPLAFSLHMEKAAEEFAQKHFPVPKPVPDDFDELLGPPTLGDVGKPLP
jgi:hypothetical protein